MTGFYIVINELSKQYYKISNAIHHFVEVVLRHANRTFAFDFCYCIFAICHSACIWLAFFNINARYHPRGLLVAIKPSVNEEQA
jgi:hypothetical protein